MAKIECDLLVIGGGPGGYSAAFRAADLGLSVIIAEQRPTLGGVCLNVGCIPSKTYLHQAALLREAAHVASVGISFGEPTIDIDALRAHKDGVVGKLVGGLSGLVKQRKVRVITGTAGFTDAHTAVVTGNGEETEVTFHAGIIAVGSAPVRLDSLPDDPRVLDSTSALELPASSGTMLIIGGGIIGLEMATIYSALGVTVDIVELSSNLVPGADRDLMKVWTKENESAIRSIMLETKLASAKAGEDGLTVTFERKGAPAKLAKYDFILSAVGRTPNGGLVDADQAGVTVDERGFIPVDAQMRTNVPHIFAIGDVVHGPMLAHKAVHQGHVAAEVAAGEKLGDTRHATAAFDARVIPSVAYTTPEVAWVGVTEGEMAGNGNAVVVKFPWSASGRALANGCESGFTKLIFDKESSTIVGGALIGPGAGDMIGEIALAIEMGAEAADIALTIHPHPTLGETIGLSAEVALGSCTDLPPTRSKL